MEVAPDEDGRERGHDDEDRDEGGRGQRQPDNVALLVFDEGQRERLPPGRIFDVDAAARIHDKGGAGLGVGGRNCGLW